MEHIRLVEQLLREIAAARAGIAVSYKRLWLEKPGGVEQPGGVDRPDAEGDGEVPEGPSQPPPSDGG